MRCKYHASLVQLFVFRPPPVAAVRVCEARWPVFGGLQGDAAEMMIGASQVHPDEVRRAAGVAVLFKGARHRVDAFTGRAGQIAPRLERGATVRSVFKAREARLPILALDSVCDTREPIVIREPMWNSIDWSGPEPRPQAIRFVIRPVLKDEDSNRVLGAYVEATRVIMPVDLEIDPVIETTPGSLIGDDVKRIIAPDPVYEALPALYEQGAVAWSMAKAHGLSADDAIKLLAIRDAARQAFIAGVRPFVEELRRQRAHAADAIREASTLVGGVIALLNF